MAAMTTLDEAVSLFVARFPKLREPSEEFFREWRSTLDPANPSYGGHYIWVDVLFHEVMYPLLDSAPEDAAGLAAFFRTLEELAVDADGQMREFLKAGILEIIGDYDARLERARRFMGPRTRRLSDDIERSWGRTHPALDSDDEAAVPEE
jgi:hypothetical protein